MAESEQTQLLRQLIAQQEILTKVLDAQCKALDVLSRRVSILGQAPFGIAFICIVSGFFYIGKTSEVYWLGSCALAALPYYAEYVPMIIKIWQKKETK
jgi:hypothetical protein